MSGRCEPLALASKPYPRRPRPETKKRRNQLDCARYTRKARKLYCRRAAVAAGAIGRDFRAADLGHCVMKRANFEQKTSATSGRHLCNECGDEGTCNFIRGKDSKEQMQRMAKHSSLLIRRALRGQVCQQSHPKPPAGVTAKTKNLHCSRAPQRLLGHHYRAHGSTRPHKQK